MERDSKSKLAQPAVGAQIAARLSPIGPVTGASLMSCCADAAFDVNDAEKAGNREGDSPLVSAFRVLASEHVGLLGLVGDCLIPGCDVHLLEKSQEVVLHLSFGGPTPAGYDLARSYWEAPDPNAVAVLVFQDRLEILRLDGTCAPLRTR